MRSIARHTVGDTVGCTRCRVQPRYRFVDTTRIERDERKNHSNQVKHGISFETAAKVFDDPNAVMFPERIVKGEERWHVIGRAGGFAILLVAHTVIEHDDEERIRIISARKAIRRERAVYPAPH